MGRPLHAGGQETAGRAPCRYAGETPLEASPTARLVGQQCAGSSSTGGLTVTVTGDADLAMRTLALRVGSRFAVVGLAAPAVIDRHRAGGVTTPIDGCLRRCRKRRLVAFDKTGTPTSGKVWVDSLPVRSSVDRPPPCPRPPGWIAMTTHALHTRAVSEWLIRGVEFVPTHDVRAVPGRGIVGHVDGGTVAAGNLAFMRDLRFPVASGLAERGRRAEASGHSVIYVGWGDQTHAVISLDDAPVPEARVTIGALRARGLRMVVLTGDLAAAAHRVAAGLGIVDVRAGLTPEDKRIALDWHRKSRDVVAMVGDGLNDGLVLVEADVGIAVGTATDLARETASVVLPVGGLWLLPWIIDVARAVGTTVRTNLLWAFGYNLVALTLAASGMLQPIIAAAVMAGSSILVVLNSLRLERLPDPVPPQFLERPSDAETARGGVGLPVALGPAIERG